MEENKKITLRIGDVSWDKNLGQYYIDMRPSILHYVRNIYGGKFDDEGVPLIKMDGDLVYSPINIAQYGLILHSKYLNEGYSEKDLDVIDKCISILEKIKVEKENYIVWYNNFDSKKYGLKKPWPSSMAQGEIISLYLRMYQITGKEFLLDNAVKAFNFLKLDVKDGGVKRYDNKGDLWFEEYPTKEPLLVLNGFVYTVFGLVDLYRVTGNKEVKDYVDLSFKTLKENVKRYDAGFWSFYDLKYKELVRYYYQKNVHVPQMEVLYKLTGEKVFLDLKNKWQKQLNFINYSFVNLMYRLKYRMPKAYYLILRLWKN